MNNKFDELTKGLAQSVTRRGALKKFGVGLAGMALACFGLPNKAAADQKSCNTCLKNCMDYYESQEMSKKDAGFYCQTQCAWVCTKTPI
jgi:hypothetical protein